MRKYEWSEVISFLICAASERLVWVSYSKCCLHSVLLHDPLWHWSMKSFDFSQFLRHNRKHTQHLSKVHLSYWMRKEFQAGGRQSELSSPAAWSKKRGTCKEGGAGRVRNQHWGRWKLALSVPGRKGAQMVPQACSNIEVETNQWWVSAGRQTTLSSVSASSLSHFKFTYVFLSFECYIHEHNYSVGLC